MRERPTSSVPLGDHQEALESHFKALAAIRSGSQLPVFALEHCLSAAQLNEIGQDLKYRVRWDFDLSRHWLLWVAWITERGYAYDGDEFWNSFEKTTPGWTFQHRGQVSSWFKDFQRAYSGVTPTGDWARHFSIIAWPITHAILPRYHQRHFAQALYELRFDLAHLVKPDAARIGALLTSTQSYASTRFAAFLQQEDLAGRIGLALLGEHASDATSPIHLPTLNRIVADLEQVRSARHWLHETRKVVTHRFKGLSSSSRTDDGPDRAPRTPQSVSSRCDLKPKLALRRRGSVSWCLTMEVPSFRPIGMVSAEIRSFLQKTRCQLSGAPDLKPGEWLLSANRVAVLRAWPEPHRPLVSFEQSHPLLDFILSNEGCLGEQPFWLFRCGADGVARIVDSHIVRPSSEYILVARATTRLADLPLLEPCHIECSGVISFKFSLPDRLPDDLTQDLQSLGLNVARTVRIWPAGLAAKAWDGEGDSEWLTTDAPCLGLLSDYPVSRYRVRLDDGPETIVEAGPDATPAFLQLSPLSSGPHILAVAAEGVGAVQKSQGSELKLNVRQPEPWIGGVTGHAGLVVTLDPPDNDLESLWQNKLRLSVFGPKAREVTVKISLERADGTEISCDQIGEPVYLPIPSNELTKRLERYVQRADSAWNYLEASSGALTVHGGELGNVTLRFERQVAPLRWITRQEQGRVILRLIDDSGTDGSKPNISKFQMASPLIEQKCLDDGLLSTGLIIDPPGGVYVAAKGDYTDEIVVSTADASSGLSGLAIYPSVPELRAGSVTPTAALSTMARWAECRQAGYLSTVRQRKIIETICEELFSHICGSDWAQAERCYQQNCDTSSALEALKTRVQPQSGIAAVLVRDFEKSEAEPTNRIFWYSELANRYGICSEPEVCECALRLASQPDTVVRTFGARTEDTLNRMIQSPSVLRGARLLALLSANKLVPGSLLPRWQW